MKATEKSKEELMWFWFQFWGIICIIILLSSCQSNKPRELSYQEAQQELLLQSMINEELYKISKGK